LSEPERRRGDPGPDRRGGEPPEIVLGLVAAPGPAEELAREVLPDLPGRVAERLPGAAWAIRFLPDRLVEPPAELAEVISAGRGMLLRNDWQLVVCVTDLPLSATGRPVVAHASAAYGVAVLSLPALGAVAVAPRAIAAIVRLVAALLGDAQAEDTSHRRHRAVVTRRMHELGARVEPEMHGFRFVAGVVSGNLRLLIGMLRANRPWRLAVRLSRALVAALAAGVFALVTSDIWRLADGMGAVRLALIAFGSVLSVVLTLMFGARLWERLPRHSAAREQVILFNLVTVTTVVIGVLALYAALFALTLAGAVLLVPGNLLADAIGHRTTLRDQLGLAWLASSVATLGGALGAGLESDSAVREAAYGYHSESG
jgi:hypothetical protein